VWSSQWPSENGQLDAIGTVTHLPLTRQLQRRQTDTPAKHTARFASWRATSSRVEVAVAVMRGACRDRVAAGDRKGTCVQLYAARVVHRSRDRTWPNERAAGVEAAGVKAERSPRSHLRSARLCSLSLAFSPSAAASVASSSERSSPGGMCGAQHVKRAFIR
jgi:hypothetical protein